MKIINFRLYEQAGDGGAGGGDGQGVGSASSSGEGSGASILDQGTGGASAGAGSGAGPQAGVGQGQGGQGAGNSQQAAGAASWFVGLYDSAGKIDPAKFDALPAHLKAHKDTFAKYQTVEALLGGFANVASLAGKKALAPLPPDASPEAKAERAKLMAQLNNVPEKPEGYGFKRPDNIPESQWNQDYVSGIAGILHKHAVSPEAAKELMEFDLKHAGEIGTKSEAARTAAEAGELKALRDEWGADYAKNIDLAVRGAKTLGMDPKDPIFKSAKAVKMVAKFASMISEDKLVNGESSANAGMDDRAKALDILNNPANPLHKAYHDSSHPQHAQAVETRSRFNQAWLAKQKAGSKS
jgi:hypothetical protein